MYTHVNKYIYIISTYIHIYIFILIHFVGQADLLSYYRYHLFIEVGSVFGHAPSKWSTQGI